MNMNNPKKNFVIAVPARLESLRLPNKLLLKINNYSIIYRVLDRLIDFVGVKKIALCTDNIKLIDEANKLKVQSIITSKECSSGSERIASVYKNLVKKAHDLETTDFIDNQTLKNTLIINVQGDQPFLEKKLINQMIDFCLNRDEIPLLTTPVYKLTDNKIHDPNIVKVLINKQSNAIYFSRSAIPYIRGDDKKNWHKHNIHYGHVGIYGYRADMLAKWFSLKDSVLENHEKLEQLKLIDNGYFYKTFLVEGDHLSIDTEAQLEQARKFLKN